MVTNLRADGVGCPLEDLPITEGRLRYSNSELTEIVDFRAVFFVLGDTRIILSGIICCPFLTVAFNAVLSRLTLPQLGNKCPAGKMPALFCG